MLVYLVIKQKVRNLSTILYYTDINSVMLTEQQVINYLYMNIENVDMRELLVQISTKPIKLEKLDHKHTTIDTTMKNKMV